MNEIDEKIKQIEHTAKKDRKWTLIRFDRGSRGWTPVYRRMDQGMEFAKTMPTISECVDTEYDFWRRL